MAIATKAQVEITNDPQKQNHKNAIINKIYILQKSVSVQ